MLNTNLLFFDRLGQPNDKSTLVRNRGYRTIHGYKWKFRWWSSVADKKNQYIYIYIWREIFGGFSVKKRVSEEIGESVWERIIRVWKSEVEVESSEDDWGGAERSAREEGESEVQRGRHHRRPEETRGGADGYPIRQDPDPEVVQHLQGPYHP